MAHSTSHEGTLPRENNFNLLRLLLASLVLLSHSFELIDGDRSREPLTRLFHTISFGEFAVDGFFLLSGYLIVGSYVQNPSFGRFLQHRILRIYPGFIGCALLCGLVIGPLGASPGYFSQVDLGIFLAGIAALHVDGLPPVFESFPYPVVNGAVWSLQPEFQCYLLALVCGIFGAFRRKWLWLAIGIVFVVLFSLHTAHIEISLFGRRHDFYRQIYRLGMFFVAGGYLRLLDGHLRLSPRIAFICFCVLLVCLRVRELAEPALAVCGGYILIWSAYYKVVWLDPLKRLPDVSYGTYLYGWPIQKLLLLTLSPMHPLLLFCLALPLAWLVGAVSWSCIEKPALGLRNVNLLHKFRLQRAH